MADAVPAEKDWRGGSVESLVNEWGMSLVILVFVKQCHKSIFQWFVLTIYICIIYIIYSTYSTYIYVYIYICMYVYIYILYIYIMDIYI